MSYTMPPSFSYAGSPLPSSMSHAEFLSHFDGSRGELDKHKAGAYFREFKEQAQQVKDSCIIHEREFPPPAPHRYVAGPVGPLHFGVPLSEHPDPGVSAVSSALFGGNACFTRIPIQQNKPIFRRRRRGDALPEWSNAFVTRVDPCECGYPEETYTPYEVAKYTEEKNLTTQPSSISYTA
ncbi:hypothetical protein, conserved [Eimeria acervulina]|uniref:Uncharacterized protein n=1 Tax=Eimeria acervulina TaxID=5801 RepID=U6GKU9_EIMAC|nr:hypothetical protein, conserved [Eimeria acervulina]CDI80851.1 hypothetical protein, conserved [Eimeria acervulina]